MVLGLLAISSSPASAQEQINLFEEVECDRLSYSVAYEFRNAAGQAVTAQPAEVAFTVRVCWDARLPRYTRPLTNSNPNSLDVLVQGKNVPGAPEPRSRLFQPFAVDANNPGQAVQPDIEIFNHFDGLPFSMQWDHWSVLHSFNVNGVTLLASLNQRMVDTSPQGGGEICSFPENVVVGPNSAGVTDIVAIELREPGGFFGPLKPCVENQFGVLVGNPGSPVNCVTPVYCEIFL
ncbi:MAG: hypothetical protein AAF962_22705 [Actinomycetota bacterium]